MEIKQYAPVIIPTLNRYDHFRQCLESLEKCIGAENTDVYVGLDYPPSEKYIDGWKKIDNYLCEKEKYNEFKHLMVFRRVANCGLNGNRSNGRLLIDFVKQKYDIYIYSEDDNVFSPNFLEYINKGLEKFKDDPSVFSINGYCHPYNFKFGSNNYFYHNVDFSAWGYGMWTEKMNECCKNIREDEIFRRSFSFSNICKVKKNGYNRLLSYIFICLRPTMKNARITDGVLSLYMVITNKNVVMPSLSKVRNIGWDLEGSSFKNGMTRKQKRQALRHNNQIIDKSISFEYQGNPLEYYYKNRDIAVKESDGKISLSYFVFSLIRRILLLLSKYIYHLYK